MPLHVSLWPYHARYTRRTSIFELQLSNLRTGEMFTVGMKGGSSKTIRVHPVLQSAHLTNTIMKQLGIVTGVKLAQRFC
jgi:hypothetical protein